MAFTTTIHVDCSPEQAFDLMADARNEVHWNSAVSRSELASGEPVGPGSRFITANRGREYSATISSFDRPGRLGFEVSGTRMEITATFTFAPESGAVMIEERLDFRPKWPARVLSP